MVSERASQRAFLGVSAPLFAASAAATIVWCAPMSAVGGIGAVVVGAGLFLIVRAAGLG